MKLDNLNSLIAFIVLIWAIVGHIFGWITLGDATIFIVLSFLIAIQKTVSLPKKI